MVRSGQVVKVKVMEVDVDRKRIGLSLRLNDEPGQPAKKPQRNNPRGGRNDGRTPARGGQGQRRQAPSAPAGGAMSDALRRAGLGR